MTEKLGDWEDNDRVVRKGRLWCKENKFCSRNVGPSGVVKPCSQGSWRAGRKRQAGGEREGREEGRAQEPAHREEGEPGAEEAAGGADRLRRPALPAPSGR